NALEVKEAIYTLKGQGPEDLFELCLVLGSKLLVLAEKAKDELEGRAMLIDAVNSGKAYDKLIEMVRLQNGDISYIENPDLLPQAKYILEVKSNKDAYVKAINAEEVGKCALALGAGRETKESILDLAVGIVLNKKVDDKVEAGEALAYIHTNDIDKAKEVEERLLDIFVLGEKNKENKQLIYKEINHI
ncbi:MAG: pyrimidine-nucleoside phosphorylase, partial [Tissierellales bacterium]